MPNQNNNEEWYLIGKSLHNYFKTAKVVRVNDVLTAIKDNVDYLISQAEQRGKREGLERFKEIVGYKLRLIDDPDLQMRDDMGNEVLLKNTVRGILLDIKNFFN